MYRNYLIAVILFFAPYLIFAQNDVDALRYSQYQMFGTARMMGMGGAFSACGGDISAIQLNPGGIGIYRSSDISFSPSLHFSDFSANLNGSENTDLKYAFIAGNIGAVKSWIIPGNAEKQDWRALQFAFSYNRTHQFSRNIFAEGINNQSSMLDFFTSEANNGRIDTLFTGIDVIYFDTVSQSFISDYKNSGYGESQQLTLNQTGGGGQYSFSFGANYSDLIYCGVSLNFHQMLFEENASYTETDPDNHIPFLNHFNYQTTLKTRGDGFSMNFGMIFRPTDWVRLGLAYQTPVFYSFEDKYNRKAEASITYTEGTFTNTKNIRFMPYQWELTTPFVTRAGVAFTIMKTALISLDADFLNYNTARLGSDDYNFKDENQAIAKHYRNAFNIRAGGEYRLGPFQFRAGYSFFGNPYASGEPNHNAKNRAISFGFGLRDKNMSVDFAWSHHMVNEKYFAYGIESSRIDLKGTSNQIIATLGFRF